MPYQNFFSAAQQNVYNHSTVTHAQVTAALGNYVARSMPNADSDFYAALVEVVFYSGFKAATVTPRLPTIHRYFNDFRVAAAYGPTQVAAMKADPNMLGHENKIKACIANAQQFVEILRDPRYPTFRDYIDSFGPFNVIGNIMNLRQELSEKFQYLGDITTYHFMMDIGIDVVKPDRVLRRIFHRLGLINRNAQLPRLALESQIVSEGRTFASGTGHSCRLIDYVFVVNGQVEVTDLGMKGICLENNPRCSQCQMDNWCPKIPG